MSQMSKSDLGKAIKTGSYIFSPFNLTVFWEIIIIIIIKESGAADRDLHEWEGELKKHLDMISFVFREQSVNPVPNQRVIQSVFFFMKQSSCAPKTKQTDDARREKEREWQRVDELKECGKVWWSHSEGEQQCGGSKGLKVGKKKKK